MRVRVEDWGWGLLCLVVIGKGATVLPPAFRHFLFSFSFHSLLLSFHFKKLRAFYKKFEASQSIWADVVGPHFADGEN